MTTLSSLLPPSNILTATNTQTVTNKTLVDPIVTLDSTQGTAGQAVVSQGAGQPPVWADAGITTGKAIAMAIVFG